MATDADPTLATIAMLLADIRDAVARPEPLPLLLTARQAARMLGVSKSGLYRLAAAGALTAVEVPGAGTRFKKSDLERFAEKLKPSRRRRSAAT